MFIIREVVQCRPGKVRQLIEKFRVLSTALKEMGGRPFRLMTDVTGEPFWTLVAETEVEKIDDFFAFEQRLRQHEGVRKAMEGYHDLVERGRREVYRLEA